MTSYISREKAFSIVEEMFQMVKESADNDVFNNAIVGELRRFCNMVQVALMDEEDDLVDPPYFIDGDRLGCSLREYIDRVGGTVS